MPTTTLSHYTITTGHLRESPRAEVGDDIIELLRPLLATGEHPMPRDMPGYRVRVTIDGATLAATVLHQGAPLVTAYVALDELGLRRVVRASGAVLATPLTPPACLVDIHRTTVGHPALGWLGDFERCLAWAWVERNRQTDDDSLPNPTTDAQ